MTASDVLHERMPADDHACSPVAFESAHWAEPRFEPSVVGFDPIVRILLGVVERVRHELLDHRAQRRSPVGHDLDRFAVSTKRRLEEPACRGGVASR
jgi:hypothetical protein